MSKKPHDDYPYKLAEIYEELTGGDWDEAPDDESGTYFDREHWVDGKSIAEALKAVADYYDD